MLVDLLNKLDVIAHDESIDLKAFLDFQRVKHGITADRFIRSKYNFFEAFNFTDSIYYDVQNVTSYSWRVYRFFPGFIPALKKNKIFDKVKSGTTMPNYFVYLNFRDKNCYVCIKYPLKVLDPFVSKLLHLHSEQGEFLKLMENGFGVSDSFSRFCDRVFSGDITKIVKVINDTHDPITHFNICDSDLTVYYSFESFRIADKHEPEDYDTSINIDSRFVDKPEYFLQVKEDSTRHCKLCVFEGTFDSYTKVMNDVDNEISSKGLDIC